MRAIRSALPVALAIAVILGATPPARAAGGDLDTGFSGDGLKTTDFGSDLDEGTAVAVQSDGKIVEVGSTIGASGGDFAIARYRTNGSLDPTFSGDGQKTTDFWDLGDFAYGVAIQADGRIVVVGQANNGTNEDFAIARYRTNGALDSSFSGDGRRTASMSSTGFEIATAVAIQDDGAIVVAGYADLMFAVMRFEPNGRLDRSFSGDGKQVTDVASGTDQALGVAVQGNGKILLAGTALNGADGDFALARYRPGGNLDSGFGLGGIVTTDLGSTLEAARAIAIQDDGAIVLAGKTVGLDEDFAVARYRPSGELDDSFSDDGFQTTDVGLAVGSANAVAIQSNGRIILAGVALDGLTSSFAVARYRSTGNLDLTFSGDGWVLTDFGRDDIDVGRGVAIQANGKIVVCGFALVGAGLGGSDFALARYEP